MMFGLLTILSFTVLFVFVPLTAPPITWDDILNFVAMLALVYLQFYCAI
jgi:hypothetical protein